jgi:hypothetical protein
MSDQARNPSAITEELSKMGKLISQAVQSAWESEERKKLEAEVTEGLRKFSDEVTAAAKKASESDTAKQLRVQAEKVAAEVKEHDIAEEVRKGLLVGLEAINQELGKLVERLEPKKAPVAPAPEPPAEAPAEPAPPTSEA